MSDQIENESEKVESRKWVAGGPGRKPKAAGGQASPRKVFAECVAIGASGELIAERVMTISPVGSGQDVLLSEVREIFRDKYGVEPQYVGKLSFNCEFVCSPSGKKKENDIIDIDLCTLSYKKQGNGTAIFRDWNVSFRLIENQSDAAFIYYKSRVDGSNRPNPGAKVVKISALQNYNIES